ncbi:MAG: hypothetical protein IJS45_03910 [Clostridia bacterium]|nr:hypothetical protein [Clostridia bacterium]
MNSYYENLLSPAERTAYRDIARGLADCEKQFQTTRFDMKRLGEIFSMVRLDDPMIFHADSLNFSYVDGSSKVTVKPVYTMMKQEYEDTCSVIAKRLKKIFVGVMDFCDVERERFVHDYIVRNVRYDRPTKQYSHEITGPLCHGIGVCEGMAKTFKLLCNEAGIESVVVTGIGVPPDESTGKKSERHAWNVVFIDDAAYAVDVTFDATLSAYGRIRYDYFNVTDEVMARSHGDTDFPAPACTAMFREGDEC